MSICTLYIVRLYLFHGVPFSFVYDFETKIRWVFPYFIFLSKDSNKCIRTHTYTHKNAHSGLHTDIHTVIHSEFCMLFGYDWTLADAPSGRLGHVRPSRLQLFQGYNSSVPMGTRPPTRAPIILDCNVYIS